MKRHLELMLFCGLVAACVPACVSPPVLPPLAGTPIALAQPAADYDYEVNNPFLYRALKLIDEQYLRDVDYLEFIFASIQALPQLDERLVIRRSESGFSVEGYGQRREFQFPLQRRQLDLCANLMYSVLEYVVKISPIIAGMDYAEAEQRMLGAGVVSFDPTSSFVVRNDARAKAERGGSVGLTLRYDRSRLVVSDVMEGSPAEVTMLQPGDQIIAIDNIPAHNKGLYGVMDLLRGPIGSAVRLEVRRPGASRTESIKLVRDSIRPKPSATIHTVRGVTYIRLNRFDADAQDMLEEYLGRIQRAGTMGDANGIIIDLRKSTGGSIDGMVNASALFLSPVEVVRIKGKNPTKDMSFKASDYRASLNRQIISKPVIVLVDEQTSWASAAFAAAIRDQKRGVIIGERTRPGTGGVQSAYPIKKAGDLILTTGELVRPSGAKISDGVQPNVCVPRVGQAEGAQDCRSGWSELPLDQATDAYLALARQLVDSPSAYREAIGGVGQQGGVKPMVMQN